MIPSQLEGVFSKDKDEIDIKQKIVEELLTPENNLETKTEIEKPAQFATMDVIREILETSGLELSEKILAHFEKKFMIFSISKDRQGRKEYIEALKSLSKLERNEIGNIEKLMKR